MTLPGHRRYVEAFAALQQYIESRDYTGFDLYDGLKSVRSRALLQNPVVNAGVTHLFKRNPVDLRKLAGIGPTTMPKTLGICLQAYALLAGVETDAARRRELLARGDSLVDRLDAMRCAGHSGACWNFGFPYKKMFDKPTAVITAIVAKGLYHHHRVSGSSRAGGLLAATEPFFLRDLVVTRAPEGWCFSYTPGKADCCYNANMLVGESLARIHSLTGEETLLEPMDRIVDFTLSHQHGDGRWNYSLRPDSGREREQVDFHQGYVLESLHETMRLVPGRFDRAAGALDAGTAFYRRHQFYPDGRARWRIPKNYPIDIHNQAQGVILFSLLAYRDASYLPFARTVLDWTLDHMRAPDGHFHYQVHRLYTNRIAYMRWAQAWMFLSFARLFHAAAVPVPDETRRSQAQPSS